MENKVKVSLVIKSHLNDAMIEMNYGMEKSVDHRLRYVNYLVHYFPDTNQEIIPDFVYDLFLNSNASK
jgi:hypothetical protein